MLRCRSPTQRAAVQGSAWSGGLEQVTRGALDFETLVGVRDRAGVRGRGYGHVPHGLDRPILLGEVDGLDRLDHAFSEPVGEEGVEIIGDLSRLRLFDRLHDRLGRAFRVLFEYRNGLFEPPVGRALGVTHPNLLVLGGSPDDAVAADVIEEEKPGAEGLVTLL